MKNTKLGLGSLVGRWVKLTFLLVVALMAGASCGSGTVATAPEDGGSSEGGTGPVTPVSLALTPPVLSLAAGTSATVKATVTMSDNTTQDVTSTATWASSDSSIATAVGGTVAGIKAGSATITVQADALSATLAVTVTSATLRSLSITPAAPSLAVGVTQQLTATATFSDTTTQDVTSQAAWSSATAATATVSNAGLVTGVATGTSVISAALNGVTGRVTVTVTGATLTSIGVTPALPSVANGVKQQFVATGVYSDNSTHDVTTQATWSSDTTTVATVSNTSGSQGLASTVGVGSAKITATLGTVSGTATLTVTAATLVSIAVTPPTPSIALGLKQQFVATGTYTDSTTNDLSATATWASSTPATATISNASGAQGLATSAAPGTTTITATLGSVVSPGVTLTVTPAALVSIAITPPTDVLALGLAQQFSATGTYTDTTTQNLTSTVTWTSGTPATATISNAAGSQGLATSAAAGTTTITATLGSVVSPGATLTVTSAALVSIAVTPPSPSIALGLTQQFAATGTYTDNSTHDLTGQATWLSDTPATATISNASGSEGLAQSAGIGTALITATVGTIVSPPATLTVTPATLVSIAVTPPSPSIALGLSQQFVAMGTYTDATTQDLSTTVTWTSGTPATATVSNASGSQGLAQSAAVGTTSITATLGGVTSAGATLTVTPATLVSIAVTPPTPSIALGLSQQFVAMGTYTDATTQDLSTTVTWTSGTPATATISNASGSQGLAQSAAVGTTSITATFGGVTSAGATLTVTPATLVSIAVTPPTASIALGLTQQFTATGTYTDATTQNLTTTVTWASGTLATATISNASGSQGLATSAAVGTTSITAALGGVTSAGATLTVTPATLVSIAVTPPTPSIAKGLTQQFVATGTYTDTTTQNLTTSVTWTSGTPATATISNAVGTQGLATSAAVGTTSITATLGGVTSPGATLTVTPATLVSIAVTPPAPSIAKGLTQQFVATGTYTDTTTQVLTTAVTWMSGTPATATISNAGGTQGLATSAAVGTTSITATLGGVTSPGATLTVTPATLVSIAVTPPTPSIAKGLKQQFVATGTYTDTTTQNLTTTVMWTSGTPATATISNAVGTQGLATSAAVGTTSITATLGGVTSPGVTLTVTAATLVSIGVTPAAPSIAKGLTQQFVATGTYTDTTTQNLTTTATWTSGTPATATISNAVGTQGLATSAAVGTTSITATLGGVTSPGVTLTVTAATLVSIGVTPAAPSIAKGLTQQFVAMGTYTDATTQNLTTTATWTSGTPATATISNAVGTQGLATSAAVGTTSITATLGGVTSPGVTLTVTAATLVSISVTPAAPSIAKGLTQQFVATGHYTDASTQVLTTTATWTSGTPATATISNAGGTQGLATSLAVGTTSITATLGGVTSPGVTLTVTAATLVSISVTPAAPSIAKGLTQQFVATGHYTDASTQVLTTTATWTSGTPATATISNAGGTQGLATSLAVGTTSITATLGGVTSPGVTLTVTAATLVSLAVTPAAPSIAQGLTQQFVATGTYTDTSTQDLTTTATWTSGTSATATISNAAGSQGLATSLAVGTTSITAMLGGVSGSTTLTVTSAPCGAGTMNHCVLTSTNSGSTDTGTCAAGYTGACSFSCSDGTWTQVTDTCVASGGCGRFTTGYTGSWATVAASPFGVYGMSQYLPSTAGGSTMYIESAPTSFDGYSTSTNSYTALAGPSAAFYYYNSTAYSGGFLWSFTSGDLIQYNIATNAWTTTKTGLTTSSTAQTAADDSGNIWGYQSEGTLQEYNTSTGVVTTHILTTALAGGDEPRIVWDSCAGLLYLADYDSTPFYSYNPSTGVQTTLASLPGGNTIQDGVCSDHSGHVFAVTNTPLMYQYTISTGTWTAMPSGGLTGNSNSACGVGSDGYLYATDPGTSSSMYRIQLQ